MIQGYDTKQIIFSLKDLAKEPWFNYVNKKQVNRKGMTYNKT